MINMINWLHISDLHLGSEGTITNIMRDELPIYLKRLGVKCDYVFCTGNIRTAYVSHNVFTDDTYKNRKDAQASFICSVWRAIV